MVLVAHFDDAGIENHITGALLNPPAAIVEVVDPNDYAYMGTGSSNWHAFFNDISGSSVKITTQAAIDNAVSIGTIQKFIAETLGLSMDQLAGYCLTTRRSLYNWRSDINPRDHSAERLFTLYRIAKDWHEAGTPTPSSHIHENLLGKKSLHDLLLEDKLDIDAIAFIRSRLDMVLIEDTPLADPFKS